MARNSIDLQLRRAAGESAALGRARRGVHAPLNDERRTPNVERHHDRQPLPSRRRDVRRRSGRGGAPRAGRRARARHGDPGSRQRQGGGAGRSPRRHVAGDAVRDRRASAPGARVRGRSRAGRGGGPPQFAATPSARAVGEIGLDYHYDYSPRDVQHAVFRSRFGSRWSSICPVVIHTPKRTRTRWRFCMRKAAAACAASCTVSRGGRVARAGLALGF